MRGTHFETPIRRRAVLILDVDVEPHVGIRPFDFRHKSLHGHSLVCIKLGRKGMVRHYRHC